MTWDAAQAEAVSTALRVDGKQWSVELSGDGKALSIGLDGQQWRCDLYPRDTPKSIAVRAQKHLVLWRNA